MLFCLPTYTVADPGLPIISPISPTVATGSMVATFTPSAMSTMSSRARYALAVFCPGRNVLWEHCERIVLTCVDDYPFKIGLAQGLNEKPILTAFIRH